MAFVNKWAAQYSGLLGVLAEASGIEVVQRSVQRLRKLDEAVAGYYDKEVEVHATAENLLKLDSTKR